MVATSCVGELWQNPRAASVFVTLGVYRAPAPWSSQTTTGCPPLGYRITKTTVKRVKSDEVLPGESTHSPSEERYSLWRRPCTTHNFHTLASSTFPRLPHSPIPPESEVRVPVRVASFLGLESPVMVGFCCVQANTCTRNYSYILVLP
jgi:hypothetical protein